MRNVLHEECFATSYNKMAVTIKPPRVHGLKAAEAKLQKQQQEKAPTLNPKHVSLAQMDEPAPVSKLKSSLLSPVLFTSMFLVFLWACWKTAMWLLGCTKCWQ